jgi:hypothetical protein
MRLNFALLRRCLAVAAVAGAFVAGSQNCHARCPNDYQRLDSQAQRATESYNWMAGAGRCAAIEEVVKSERILLEFVERYQVQCVLDQEYVDVQRRRVANALAARRRSCDRVHE